MFEQVFVLFENSTNLHVSHSIESLFQIITCPFISTAEYRPKPGTTANTTGQTGRPDVTYTLQITHFIIFIGNRHFFRL